MISRFATYIAIFLLKLISFLPLPFLYLLSDLLYVIVYHLVRYRRKVARENLRRAFPEKPDQERRMLEKEFYRWFCDLVVESVKAWSLTDKEISERMKIRNPELVNEFFEKGRSVIVLALHYGNWEWLSHMPLYVRHRHYFVYKPLSNKTFDRQLNGIREKFGGMTIPMAITLRKLLESERDGMPVLTWLAADQAPPWNHPFWTTFLHRETMFFNGPAKLARRFNHPVLIQHIRRVKRGRYETEFEVLTANPREMSEEEITVAYVKKAEKKISENPVCYLWTHRRWKYVRPAGIPLS